MENYSKTREQGHLSETSGLSDTGFQAVSVRTLTRQVPDFDTSVSGVCQPALPLHRCGGCHRLLPAEAFYADRQGRVADHYCKECRRAANRKNRKRRRLSQELSGGCPDAASPEPRYVVITNLKNRSERLPLIINALETIRQRKKRYRDKLHERELREFETP
ncbi:hypothetical protein [Bacteroides rodentium]|uniref:hypothetical protein n=1 Tax=Bacteroides rodentium TaxID=691816 RepID=UPI0010082ECD|nr:hypothetical protein [Bacteroides rodentium]